MGVSTTQHKSAIDERIHGTRLSHFVREFFTNSAYFPLANIFFELLHRPQDYSIQPDPYVLILAALLQARFLSNRTYMGRPLPLLGNLIGPLVYSAFEIIFGEGTFLSSPNHIAYWSFAFAIGVTQQLQLHLPQTIAGLLILVESTLRTSILLVMYIILEFMSGDYASLRDFLQDPTHAFISVVVPFSGLMLGVALMNAERYQTILRATAGQMKDYSQWLLGKELLDMAVSDPRSLSQQWQQRAILFVNIRGFGAWSEKQGAQQVIDAINAYYEAAEPSWIKFHALKVKLTSDEIMLIFGDATTAVAAALELHDTVTAALGEHGLAAGIGVHFGQVAEGLTGTSEYKDYDLLGDNLNLAKYLAEQAGMSEILLSSETVQQLQRPLPLSRPMAITISDKRKPLTVYSVVLVNPEG